MASFPDRYTGLLYDADCGFCTRSARWLAQGRPWSPMPWQTVEDAIPGIGLSEEMVTSAAYWLHEGTVAAAGAGAIAAALRTHDGWRRLLGVLIDAPPVRPVARAVYRQVATNRHRMPGGTDACRVDAR